MTTLNNKAVMRTTTKLATVRLKSSSYHATVLHDEGDEFEQTGSHIKPHTFMTIRSKV